MPELSLKRHAEQASLVRRIFSRWSSFYDFVPVQEVYYRPVHRRLLRRLGALRSGAVLDIGCGTGQILADLEDRLAPTVRLHGLDMSDAMLGFAASRLKQPRLVRGDSHKLPFADATFDLVLNTISFHWYADPQGVAGEFARVTRPGGRLLLAGVATELLQLPWLQRQFDRWAAERVHMGTPEGILEILRAAGFVRLRATWVHLGTYLFEGMVP